MGLVVAWMGQRAEAVASEQPGVVWRLSPASNTVTVRMTPGSGPQARQVLARSHLIVTEAGNRHLSKTSPDGGLVRVPVPPGGQTSLTVGVQGPQPSSPYAGHSATALPVASSNGPGAGSDRSHLLVALALRVPACTRSGGLPASFSQAVPVCLAG